MLLKRLALTISVFTGLAFSLPAIAQECEGTPSPETLESAEKINQLLDNGLVQFGGYLAMVSYAQSKNDCVKAAVFEDLYVTAVEKMPETRMLPWRNWSRSALNFNMNAASAVEGFGGKCTIKLDILNAGAPENVRVSCDNPMMKSPLRIAFKEVVFAPPTLSEGFKKEKDVEFDFTFTQRIDEWVF